MKSKSYCRSCGNEIKVGDKFCEVCGSNVQRESTAPIKMILLSVVLIAVIVCAAAYVIENFVKPDTDVIYSPDSSSLSEDDTTVQPERSTTDNSLSIENTTEYEPLTDVFSTETPTTEHITHESTTAPTTAYSTTARQSSEHADPQNIHKDSYYIIRNTPDRAGLSVREKPDSSSLRLEIAEEDTAVKALSYYSALDNGYVYVTTSTGTNGWVLASYLYPYNPYAEDSHTYNDYIKYVRLRVSYDTPYHAGLNMRSTPSVSSEKITVLSEGAVVDVLKDYNSGDNGYIYVGYDHPHAGTYYTGWVLVEYLEYYGI